MRNVAALELGDNVVAESVHTFTSGSGAVTKYIFGGLAYPRAADGKYTETN